MKAINRAIERFCYKHPRLGIPKLMLFIVIGNAIVFLFSMMDTTQSFLNFLDFNPIYILSGQVWRIISWVFIPRQGNFLLVAIMLYFYYFIGSTLEREWGASKFTMFYLIGIILNIVYGFVVWFTLGGTMYLSSMYLNLSMFFAFATMFPDQQVLLFFIIPVKMKWLAILNAVIFGVYVITTGFPSNLIPLVALLNYFLFCGGDLIDYLRPIKARNTKQAINFRKAAKQTKQSGTAKPYNHKCAVCGKTDTDHPDLEFRYCSKCEGYHCFCQDHINNHVHFK